MEMDKRTLMQNAHKITKKLVAKYGVDYRTQLGLSMKYVYTQFKLHAQNEINEYKHNIILTLNKLVNTNDKRFNKYYELYKKYNNLSNDIIKKAYELKSLNGYMINTLDNQYVLYNNTDYDRCNYAQAIENIKVHLKNLGI